MPEADLAFESVAQVEVGTTFPIEALSKGGDQFVIARAVAPTARPVVRTATAPALTVVLAANSPAPTAVRAAQAFNEKTMAKANTILHEHKIIELLKLIKLRSHADP